MKKLATKFTPEIKAWVKEEFGNEYYKTRTSWGYFHFPNYKNNNGFIPDWHVNHIVYEDYTEVSEQEFLAEFRKKVEYQVMVNGVWKDIKRTIRIKPTPNYSKEIEALQNKAKENNQKVTIIFE